MATATPPIYQQKLERWLKQAEEEEWSAFLDTVTEEVGKTQKRIPNFWKKKLMGEDLATFKEEPRNFKFPGRPIYTTKYAAMADIVQELGQVIKERTALKETVTFKAVQHTLQKMLEEAKEKGDIPEHIKGGGV